MQNLVTRIQRYARFATHPRHRFTLAARSFSIPEKSGNFILSTVNGRFSSW